MAPGGSTIPGTLPAAGRAGYFRRAGLLCNSSLAQSCSRVRITWVIDSGRAAGSFSRQAMHSFSSVRGTGYLLNEDGKAGFWCFTVSSTS
jgi:hypothetical protein